MTSPRTRSSKSSSGEAMPEGLPHGLTTPVIGLHALGSLVASHLKVEPGIYEVVVEYRIGPCRLESDEIKSAAMGVAFGGLGLAARDEENPMTIVVGETPQKRVVSNRKQLKSP